MKQASVTSFMVPVPIILPLAITIQISRLFSLGAINQLCCSIVYRSTLLIPFGAWFSVSLVSLVQGISVPGSHAVPLLWPLLPEYPGCHSPAPVIPCHGHTVSCSVFISRGSSSIGFRVTSAVQLNWVTMLSVVSFPIGRTFFPLPFFFLSVSSY